MLNWKIRASTPFGPRAVVKTFGGPAGGIEGKDQDRRRHSRTARCDDRLVEIDAGIPECGFDAFSRGEIAIIEDAVERHVEGSRHMTEAQAGARFRRLAGKAFSRASIYDLRALVGNRHSRVSQSGDGADIHLSIEFLRW